MGAKIRKGSTTTAPAEAEAATARRKPAVAPKVKYCQYDGRRLMSNGRCPRAGCPTNA
jgi:hypothetical protein